MTISKLIFVVILGAMMAYQGKMLVDEIKHPEPIGASIVVILLGIAFDVLLLRLTLGHIG